MTDQPLEEATPEEQEMLSKAAVSPTVHKARERRDAGPFAGERGEPVVVDVPEGEPPLDDLTDRPKILVEGVMEEDGNADEREQIPLSRCDISFLINVRNVESLDEAMDTAATSLGRFGMDAFYILATNPDTGQQWIIHNGQVTDADEAVTDLENALGDSDG